MKFYAVSVRAEETIATEDVWSNDEDASVATGGFCEGVSYKINNPRCTLEGGILCLHYERNLR